MEAGAHVFVEKPLATNVADADRVVDNGDRDRAASWSSATSCATIPSWHTADRGGARAWAGLTSSASTSTSKARGPTWETHKALMETTSPARRLRRALRRRDVPDHRRAGRCGCTAWACASSDEIAPDMYNYGQFQVVFDDGSVGWYEAGWGPMMSETAFFVKDMVSPERRRLDHRRAQGRALGRHRGPHQGRRRSACTGSARPTRTSSMPDEPGHQELCDAEQAFMPRAIAEDTDLTAPHAGRRAIARDLPCRR